MEISGRGKLTLASGLTVPVRYSLYGVEQEIKAFTFNGPGDTLSGLIDLTGQVQVDQADPLIGLHIDDLLRLTLQDGRIATIRIRDFTHRELDVRVIDLSR